MYIFGPPGMSSVRQYLIIGADQMLNKIFMPLSTIPQQVGTPIEKYSWKITRIIGMLNRPLNFIPGRLIGNILNSFLISPGTLLTSLANKLYRVLRELRE
ncbi:hypothetical protein D1872_217770 [compost metagenome]